MSDELNDELKIYENPTLPEVAEFIFILLGSFCEANGFGSDLRKKYMLEPKTEFRKHNFFDGKSEISKLLEKFIKSISADYNAWSVESSYLLEFPSFLVDATSRVGQAYALPKNQNLQVILAFYFGYMSYRGKSKILSISTETIKNMISETYANIVKSEPRFDFEKLSETAKWGTIEKYLKNINETEVLENEKTEFAAKIVRHYLFLNFKKALIKVFDMESSCENTFRMIAENLEKLADTVEMRIQFGPLAEAKFTNSKELNTASWIYDILKPEEIRITAKSMLFDQCMMEIMSESISTYSQEKLADAALKCEALGKFYDTPLSYFYINWYKARALIFSLNFDDSETDKSTIQKALSLYRESFDKYKYLIGQNLHEFLVDAITADVYFNRKNLKDIIGNSQDDTGESSILKPGKTYWEFAYAVGLLPENSEKTYLVAFNAEKNFWYEFPPPKFEHYESALKKFEEDSADEELNVLNRIDDFDDTTKIDNLLSKERNDIRQKVGKRYYSNLSIAILKAETEKDFKFLKNYINAVPVEKLIKTDENGASPLVRALNEYKNSSYGFSKKYRKERTAVLFDYQKQFDTTEKYITGEFENADFLDEKLNRYLSEKCQNFQNEMLEKVLRNFECHFQKEVRNSKIQQNKAEILKNNVILPLISKIGQAENQKYAKHLLDEAVEIDTRKCVSALQLAIDCFDSEIVSKIIENLPEKKKNLAKVYISNEFTTPLQYAIRKYDLLMQCWDRIRKGNEDELLAPLEFRETPNRKDTVGGIILKDKSILGALDKAKYSLLQSFFFEECGIVYKRVSDADYEKNKNIILESQKNLYKIIVDILAKNTNPISVDNFYYLVEQSKNEFEPYGDIVDLTRALISTGNADLAGTNEEWMPPNILPEETLIARCIRFRSYGMLRLFLREYPKEFKNIINQYVMGTGSSPSDIRVETDVHMFVLNQIESTKAWLDPNDSAELFKNKGDRTAYGNMIAVKLNMFLTLFKNAGADFTIKDQAGRSVKDLLTEWKNRFPEGSIPDGIL